MNKKLVDIISKLSRLIGITYLLREFIFQKSVIILLYHDIGLNNFQSHLEAFNKYYNLIPLKKYVRAIKSGDFSDIPKKALIITFDDALKENYSLLQAVKKNNCQITLFVPTSLVNSNRHLWTTELVKFENIEYLLGLDKDQMNQLFVKYNYNFEKKYDSRQFLTNKELSEMVDFFDYQPHTKFHENLNCLDEEETLATIKESKSYLEEQFDSEIYAFAPPFGLYTNKDLKICREKLGFDVLLTIKPKLNKRVQGLFELNRIGIPDNINEDNLLFRLSGLYTFLRSLPLINKSSSFYKVFNE